MKRTTNLLLIMALLLADLCFAQQIQRVRVNFETPQGYTRQLLLGFTPDNAASDGFDYGYDAQNPDNFPDDFSWMIEDGKYVIQGVGAFDESKMYPIGLFLTNSGTIKMKLHSTENFNSEIDVFIYDAYNDTFSNINNESLNMAIDSGEVVDRFYVAFANTNNNLTTLSISDNTKFDFDLKYSKSTHELVLKTTHFNKVTGVDIYAITGQKLLRTKQLADITTQITMPKYYNGVALIRLTTKKGTFTKKVIL